ncbi:MAG: chemotaxis-specific protein-glutamate methyltransferase CheB [Thaumarchaeota archaeon]|nr:chemotaxis-specific protein-glutamate methyltransferase CheB [Nitrososphaerota archaeon]
MTSEKNQIKVMIVNDSPYMIELLRDLLSSENNIKIVETARDGLEALRKIKHLKIDVVLLDLEMPNMDGLSFIENVMKEKIVNIIIVSNYSKSGTKMILDSLELGAVDFVTMPQDNNEILKNLKNVLVSKIDAVSRSNPNMLVPKAISKLCPAILKNPISDEAASNVVVIGASTGAPRVITSILRDIPKDIQAGFLIVQHMSKEFTTSFAERLDETSQLHVKLASDNDPIQEGVALLAPGDMHMEVSSSHRIKLNQGPKRFGVRPAINVTMVSASEAFGANTIGVLLSGMGQDGAFGMKMIKKRCGITLAQNESTSVVFGMAKAANELNAVDKMVDADDLAQEIIKVIKQRV